MCLDYLKQGYCAVMQSYNYLNMAVVQVLESNILPEILQSLAPVCALNEYLCIFIYAFESQKFLAYFPTDNANYTLIILNHE